MKLNRTAARLKHQIRHLLQLVAMRFRRGEPSNTQNAATKLDLAAVKTHLAHCANIPRIGRHFGIVFTASGVPAIAAICTPER